MIIAMVAVRMVQVAVDEVIDVIAVRDRLMAAAGAVYVVLRMPAARVLRRAVARILDRYVQSVFLDLAPLGVVQVAVVQVIDVIAVLDRGVAAILAVIVIVIVLVMMLAHFISFARLG